MVNSNFDRDIEMSAGTVLKDPNGTSIITIDDNGDGTVTGDIADALASGKIYVGNASGVSAEVAMSGDATLSNTGALTIASNAVTASKLDANAVSTAKAQPSNSNGGTFLRQFAVATYDFSTDGGTAGTITLGATATIPDNAVVTAINYDVITTCTSATDAATIKLNLPTDGDLSTAIAISDGTNPWDQGVYLASVITPIAQKTTSTRAVQIVVGAENLTAGKIVFGIEFFVTE